MKKRIITLFISTTMLLSILTACGSTEAPATSQDTTTNTESTEESVEESAEDNIEDTTDTPTATATGYALVADGVSLAADADMDELLPSLKEPKSTFEAPSCAGQGTAYTYDFGSFEVETYPSENGQNLIGYITIKDDLIATAEGVELYMTRDDVVAAYGEGYTETEQGLTYEKDGSKICFVLENDEVTSIMYISPAMG
ncbi:MAG: hypothetical protein HUJ71_10825 [Pseudobutyrivibrio sp.]|nr:hypothetical protein [Pseudobutyrivibrio sp.]